jgi:broad specificity phosphatase PhoE
MVRFVLARPGATEFDRQGRIKGCMDVPLSDDGREQVDAMIRQLGDVKFDVIYTAPCQSAQQTAERLSQLGNPRIQIVDGLRNVDHGLWHGKLIDEVRRLAPTVFRAGQECADSIQPPGGESLAEARIRLTAAIDKIIRKRPPVGCVGLVIPDPLATEASALLRKQKGITDLWKCECDAGGFEIIDVEPVRRTTAQLLRIAR